LDEGVLCGLKAICGLVNGIAISKGENINCTIKPESRPQIVEVPERDHKGHEVF
jgi:hypothetical protein